MPGWGSILRSSSSAALRVLGLGLQEVSVVFDWADADGNLLESRREALV